MKQIFDDIRQELTRDRISYKAHQLRAFKGFWQITKKPNHRFVISRLWVQVLQPAPLSKPILASYLNLSIIPRKTYVKIILSFFMVSLSGCLQSIHTNEVWKVDCPKYYLYEKRCDGQIKLGDSDE